MKQVDDQTLANKAQRIRDRAVRRGGELLEQMKAARGANQNIRGSRSPKVRTRKDAAAAAGLTPDQAKKMIRTARVKGGPGPL